MRCVLIVSWDATRFEARLLLSRMLHLGALGSGLARYNGRGASPHPAGRHPRKGVFAMDAQTVIAICALLTVVVAIADLARKE